MKLIFLVILNITLLISENAFAQSKYSAGFIEIDKAAEAGIKMGLWYPSNEKEISRKWGPFRPEFAWEGNPASGTFPIIVLSHGIMGRYRNHRGTAATLARSGYVVVVPQHTEDRWVRTKRIVSAIEHRVEELKMAIQIVTAHEGIGNIVDANRIGAIGYSLGTLTVLKAGGSQPGIVRYNTHCEKHASVDKNFCAEAPWWQKLLLWFKDKGLSVKDEFSPTKAPMKFRAIALVAPIGAVFPEKEISKIKSRVAIYRLEDDQELKHPFHAEYLSKLLNKSDLEYKAYKGVHHYAFISPFPTWLLEKEYIPVAIDPEGFDRESFLKGINEDIVSLFQRNMPVK
jgi:predicted dienelactone hydrolase